MTNESKKKTALAAAPMAPPDKAAALVAVLQSEAPLKEKVDACRQLAIVGDAASVPALAALLRDEKLSHMARYGLEPIPGDAVENALREALDKLEGRQLVGVIGSLGVRRDARSVGALVRLLDHADADVAQAAARSLGRIGTREAARALQEKLTAESPALRIVAADACLACVERLLVRGRRDRAAAMCERIAKADVPEHVRRAAARRAAPPE